MARRETVTAEQILDAAFAMTREEGISMVTARRLAARLGCSTQPIFRLYKGMPELTNALYEKAVEYLWDYYRNYPRIIETPFANLGLAYIEFAQQDPNVFQLLFFSKDRQGYSLYELLNGFDGNVANEIARATQEGCKNPSQLFMKIWMFIHGAASMVITGDYDLSDDETAELLEEVYRLYQ